MLIELLKELNEGRAESGQGSKAGRKKYASGKGAKSKSVKARKARVKIFPTIKGALQSASPVGTMFSTEAADRLYVISHKKWGKDRTSQVGNRIAKGFTPGSATPNASWPSIKSHSIRTSIRHGGVASSRLKKKYGAGKHRPEEKRYEGKPSLKKANEEVSPYAVCNTSVGTEKTAKRERCIMHIKRKQGMKEQTNYEDLNLEDQAGTAQRILEDSGYKKPGTKQSPSQEKFSKVVDMETIARYGKSGKSYGARKRLGMVDWTEQADYVRSICEIGGGKKSVGLGEQQGHRQDKPGESGYDAPTPPDLPKRKKKKETGGLARHRPGSSSDLRGLKERLEFVKRFLAERSALPRVTKDDGEEWAGDGGAETDDPEVVSDLKARRKSLSKHLKKVRGGKAKPEQETADPEKKIEQQPDRKGPGGSGGYGSQTHAQAAGDIKSDIMGSRGSEAEEHRGDVEKRVSAREKQAEKLHKKFGARKEKEKQK